MSGSHRTTSPEIGRDLSVDREGGDRVSVIERRVREETGGRERDGSSRKRGGGG